MILYPTTYTDKLGTEKTSFESNGNCLKIVIRNLTFIGSNFDSLTLETLSKNNDSSFSFNENNSLTDCCFAIKIPIILKENETSFLSNLHLEITLENSQLPKTKKISLAFNNKVFETQTNEEREMWFETQMIQLQRQLPENTKMHTCIFCAYSNYWVGGSDSFGTLGCYKDIKDKIIDVRDKSEYINVAESYGVSTQETYWCPAFTEITKGQWQYKDPI